MRPIKLTMTAFGPYNGQEVIDFNVLEDKNLFLITGPTGAGKTTIFDAITYALYGETSGSDRPEKGLKCQSAPLETLSQVQLDFVLRGKTYKIHRIPSQEKPKARGQGTTLQNPEATLYLPGVERPLTGVKHVSETIIGLLGLELNQFRQIMMIPQGEFRKLLMAKSNDRKDILKKIFKSHLYEALEAKFTGEKRDLEKTLGQAMDQRLTLVQGLHLLGDQALEAMVQEERVDVEGLVRRWLDYRQDLLEIIGTLKDKQALNHKALAEQIVLEEQAKQHNNLLETYQKLKEDLRVLEDQVQAMEALRLEVASIEKAEKILPLELQYKKRQGEIESKLTLIERLKASIAKGQGPLDAVALKKADVESAAYEGAMDLKQKSIIELEGQLGAMALVEEGQKNLKNLQAKHLEALDQRDQEKSRLEANKVRAEELRAMCSKETYYTETLHGLEKEGRACQEKIQAYKALMVQAKANTELEANLKKSQTWVEGLKDQCKVLDKAYKSIKKTYFLNQAALLAQELKEDLPCPVCGSKDHPDLAQWTTDQVSKESLLEAEDLYQEALEKLSKGQVVLAGDQANLDGGQEALRVKRDHLKDKGYLIPHQEDLGKCLDQEEVAYRTLRRDYDGTKEALMAIEGHKKELGGLDLTLKKQGEALEAIRLKCQDLEVKVGEVKASLVVVMKDLPQVMIDGLGQDQLRLLQDQRRDMVDYREKIRQDYQTLKEGALQASSALETHQASLLILRDQEGLEKDAFDKALEAMAWSITTYTGYRDDCKTLEKSLEILKNFDQNLHASRAALGAVKLDLKSFEPLDLNVYVLKRKALEEENQGLIEGLGQKTQGLEANDGIVEKIKAINGRIAKEEDRYKMVGHIADVVSGKNSKNMTFEGYVLSSYLRDILVLANHRFSMMTNHRYHLQVSNEVADKRSSSGLDLEVIDGYTGMTRSVKTLSGGESFKASLAMALGLAEVVEHNAGGIALDTVFIDEGFGTLDQESLDNAITCLIDLQDSGRLVGIISHVEALKESIKTQLVIDMDESGSTTSFVV